MGWIGMARELSFYLATVGADKDPDGKYLIAGAPVVFGLGGDEVVVPDETCYLVDGQRKALAAGLNTTSYGVNVKVF